MELYPVKEGDSIEFSISHNSFFSELTIASIPSVLLRNIKYLLHDHLQLKTVRQVYRCIPVYSIHMYIYTCIHTLHTYGYTEESDIRKEERF